MKIKLDHVNVVDELKFQKNTGEMIFSVFLQSTISNMKLQTNS